MDESYHRFLELEFGIKREEKEIPLINADKEVTLEQMMTYFAATSNFPTVEEFEIREFLVRHVGYTFPTEDWIRPLAKWINHRKVLEICSGKGVLAHHLQRHGVQITATDLKGWDWYYEEGSHANNPVEEIDALQAIEKYGNESNVLLMSWVPYLSTIDLKALKLYRKVKP